MILICNFYEAERYVITLLNQNKREVCVFETINLINELGKVVHFLGILFI